jgi:hypothetical protein
MAGIDFDRQVFVPPTEPSRRFALQALGPALFVLAIGAVSLVGYKIYSEKVRVAVAGPTTPEVDLLRQQLADMQKRLDQVEKHRRPIQDDPLSASKVKPLAEPKSAPLSRIVYQVTSASKLPAVSKPAPPATPAPSANANISAVQNELAANHEAWQATTDRLADVVGVVGAQQGEISQTREALNQLLAQSKRRALSFELQRGNSRMPIGPLTLQLRSVDTKTQRYSVCVYFEEKCIELKDRALNEVVVFMVPKDSAPLELVATKIMRDQILGYLEIPIESRPSLNEGR